MCSNTLVQCTIIATYKVATLLDATHDFSLRMTKRLPLLLAQRFSKLVNVFLERFAKRFHCSWTEEEEGARGGHVSIKWQR